MADVLQGIFDAIDARTARRQQDKVRAQEQMNKDREFKLEQERFKHQADLDSKRFDHMAMIAKAGLELQKLETANKIGESYYKTGILPAGVKETGKIFEQSGPTQQFQGPVSQPTQIQNPANPQESTLAGATLDRFVPMEQTGIRAGNDTIGEIQLQDPEIAMQRKANLELIGQEPLIRRQEALQTAQMERQLAVGKQQLEGQERLAEGRDRRNAARAMEVEKYRAEARKASDELKRQTELQIARIHSNTSLAVADKRAAIQAAKDSAKAIPETTRKGLETSAGILNDVQTVKEYVEKAKTDPKTRALIEKVFPSGNTAGVALRANKLIDWAGFERGEDVRKLIAAVGRLTAPEVKNNYGANISPGEMKMLQSWALRPGEDTFETLKGKIAQADEHAKFMWDAKKKGLPPQWLQTANEIEDMMKNPMGKKKLDLNEIKELP